MMAEYDKKTGKVAKFFDLAQGALIEGDASTALTANTWYKIQAKAASGSVLPQEVGHLFKTSATPITPIVGDDVYPMTFNNVCKADTSVSMSKGSVDVTDDCGDSYNEYITDGFTDLSGDLSAFFKFDSETGSMTATQEKYLNKFMSIAKDDGAGVYSLEDVNNEDIFLAILQNSDKTTEGYIQQWLLIPAILTGLSLGKALKSGQSFDLTWQKGLGAADVYMRTTNATETVF